MAWRYQSLKLQDFSGGLNSQANPFILQENQGSSTQNVRLTNYGSLLKRTGFSLLETPAISGTNRVTMLAQYRKDSGAQYFMTASSTVIAKQNPGVGWTNVITGLTATGQFTACVLNDTLVMMDGVNVPQSYDGTLGGALAGTPPTAKYCLTYRDYVFTANQTNKTSRLQWSGLDAPTSWPAANYVDVGLDDGEAILGLASLNQALYIFKQTRTYQFQFSSTPADGQVQPFLPVGTRSHWSIVPIDTLGLIFLSNRGVLLFDGAQVTDLSKNIWSELQSLNITRYANAVACQFKKYNEYWLTFTTSGGTTNDRVYVYNYVTGGWTTFVGINASALGVVSNSTTNQESVYHGDYSGFVYLNDSTNNDSGTAINAQYRTRWLDAGDRSLLKNLSAFTIHLTSQTTGNVTVGLGLDFQSTESTLVNVSQQDTGSLWDQTTWDTGVWGGLNTIRGTGNWNTNGRLFRLLFQNATAAQAMEVLGVELLWKPLGVFPS